MIFARFDALAAGESFVLVNSHDPIHLRKEFARDRPGAYDWRYLEGSRSSRLWRIRIIRITEPYLAACQEATTSSTCAQEAL
jgi:uncharacterized protein (DUF2249 family)